MEDIFKSIKAYLYDRAASPLVGAFAVAWSIWNYRVIAVLLSGEDIAVKFSAIDARFADFAGIDIVLWGWALPMGHIIHGFLVPAIVTVAYIYVYPFLAEPVYQHSLEKQKKLREIKQQEENNRLLTAEESREMYKNLSQLQDEYDNETEKYRNQMSSLTQTIKDLEKELSDSTTKQPAADRGTDLDTINSEAESYLFDSLIAKIDTAPDGEFQLTALLAEKDWNRVSPTGKQMFGKKFKKLVDSGAVPWVTAKRKSTSGQQIYVKEKTGSVEINPTVSLELSDQVLQKFMGHNQITAADIHKKLGGHIEEIRMYIDEFMNSQFVTNVGSTANREPLYSLAPNGRKYLVENSLLLESENAQ